jgi:chemotaxis protein MotB
MKAAALILVLLVLGLAGGGYWLYTQNRALSADLDGCTQAQQKQRSELGIGSAELSAARRQATEQRTALGELEELRQQRQSIEKQLAAFRAVTTKLQSMIDTGKLKVMVRDGRMILKLPAEVLFPSGSATLSTPGQRALAQVASVLKQFPDRSFMVAGHTDNVPVKESDYRNNWQLSTDRALSVTEYFIEQGVEPANLVAAGYGEHDPISENAHPAGRRDNRRIELVLLPNVEELPRLIQETQKVAEQAAPAIQNAQSQ